MDRLKVAHELAKVAEILIALEPKKADRLDPKTIREVNKFLIDEISTHNSSTYYAIKEVPFNEIFAHLKKFGITMLDEEGKPWKGIFSLGDSGHHNYPVGRDLGENNAGPEFKNTFLHMNWQAMDGAEKKYEFLVRLT